MSRGTMARLADEVHGRLFGDDARFDGVSTDTRRLSAGELFVALRGPNFDGNRFVPEAQRRGAAGALVDRQGDTSLPVVLVDDTRRALGAHAHAWRRRFDLPLIAVTGSNGKTTVKEMLAGILATRGDCLATRGNLNNEIGLPLTLLSLTDTHRSAVVEMGANHAGEIDALVRIAEPTVGLVNNAGPAHLEGFGSVAGVARAKGEMFAALPETSTAVINADDEYADLWVTLAGSRPKILFGTADRADVRLIGHAPTADGVAVALNLAGQVVDIQVTLPGLHNAMNAAAAAAAAYAAGFQIDAIRTGLARTTGVRGRLRPLAGVGGSRLVDDSYNANPTSLRAAIDYLACCDGERWLVFGDMGELGPAAESLHAEVGQYARDNGIERLFAIGPMAKAAALRFGSGAVALHDLESLLGALTAAKPRAGTTILVKASRTMRLERVVDALRAEPADGEAR